MKNFILFLLPVFLFVSCAKQPVPVVVEPEPEPVIIVLPKFPLTVKMIREHSLSSADICSLQFYTSHDIELQRKIPALSSTITNGSLVVSKNDKILSIVIEKGTPGVAIKAEDNYIVVKFNEEIELTFMHSYKKKDLYLLSANKWNKGKGILLVNSKEYQAVGESGQAHLMVNRTDVDNSDSNRTVVKGSLLY